MKYIAILGATKGMGRALARKVTEQGHHVCLMGRDAPQLEKSQHDLNTRFAGSHVVFEVCDLKAPKTFDRALLRAREQLGGLDTIVVTAGMFASQQELENNPVLTSELVTVNFTNTLLFCEAARKALLDPKHPTEEEKTLCVFSSVAGERGRKPVVIYGASKAGLSRYLEGLDHKYRVEGLRVVTVKPGFVKTSMTAGLKPPPFAGEPDQVAKDVIKGIEAGSSVIYTPKPWKAVMAVIRHLPRAVMRRLSF